MDAEQQRLSDRTEGKPKINKLYYRHFDQYARDYLDDVTDKINEIIEILNKENKEQ